MTVMRRVLIATAGIFMICGLNCPPLFADEPATADEVSARITDAYEALKSFTFAKKDEFLHWAEARSRDLDAKIDELQKEIDREKGPAREDLRRAKKQLLERRKELARRMDEVRHSGEQAWEDAKWGMSAALDKLEQAYQRARSRFKESREQKTD
jgi:hypothetical protein